MDYDGLWKLAKEKAAGKAAMLYPEHMEDKRAESVRIWTMKYYDDYTRPPYSPRSLISGRRTEHQTGQVYNPRSAQIG